MYSSFIREKIDEYKSSEKLTNSYFTEKRIIQTLFYAIIFRMFHSSKCVHACITQNNIDDTSTTFFLMGQRALCIIYHFHF